MAERPRNVVLLTVDALRADHLSCHGYPRSTTPALDGLAAEHLHLTNAYSASSHTREAVPAILAGRFPDAAVDGGYHLAADTVATTLSERGFATGAFHSNPYVSRAYGYDAGFDAFDDDLHLGSHKLVALAQRAFDKLRNRHYARAETINRRSLDWLDSLGPVDDRPFFLWNHYMDAHGPYEPPAAYRSRFHDRDVGDRRVGELYRRAVRSPSGISDEERRTLRDLYDAEVRYVDDHLREFLDALDERGLLADSLVLVTADHGEAFGEHGRFEHPRYLFPELVRVPFVALGPGVPSLESDRPASTLDVVPTILAAVGASAEDLPGSPLQDLPDVDGDRYVFGQARSSDRPSVRRYRAWGREGSAALELDTAPGEDAIARLAVPESDVEAALREHCADRLARVSDAGTGSSSSAGVGDPDADEDDDATADAEVVARLEALGYRE